MTPQAQNKLSLQALVVVLGLAYEINNRFFKIVPIPFLQAEKLFATELVLVLGSL